MEKRVYRLPTEAEWEYACRAGTTTPFAFGETISSDDVNFKATVVYGDGEKGVYRARPVAADGMTPNDWGIIGMHGNVQEWCSDWYDQDYYEKSPKVDPTGPATGRMKALRGGSYVTHPQYCRSAHRFGASPGHKFMSIGFRVVCEPRTDANEEAR
jgi:formylglycine-generating enzyme required for sulfatase activity